jgi:hypothetical protein
MTYANIQRLDDHQPQLKNSPIFISTSLRSVLHRSYMEGQQVCMSTSQPLVSGRTQRCILISVNDCTTEE